MNTMNYFKYMCCGVAFVAVLDSCVSLTVGVIPYMDAVDESNAVEQVSEQKKQAEYCYIMDTKWLSSSINEYKKTGENKIAGYKNFTMIRNPGMGGDCVELYGTPVNKEGL